MKNSAFPPIRAIRIIQLRWFLRFAGLAALACLVAGAPLARAQSAYPSKPIRIISPYSPGGAADTVARTLAPKLSEALGQPVIVENRVGASGIIGADHVAKAAPDGYTLLVNLGPSHHTIQFFSKNVPYDPVKDFTPITIVGTAPQAIVVPSAMPVKTVGELLEFARRNPGKVSYGTSGVGTSQHLGGLLLGIAGKAELTHIAYKGGAAALNDVLGGQIQVAILVLSNVLPHVRAGRLRALGVLEAKRARGAPTIPTTAESGVPGYALPDTWVGILGPAGMPPAIVARLDAEITKAMADVRLRTRLEAAGFEVSGSTPEAFSELLTNSVQVYQKIVTQAHIQSE